MIKRNSDITPDIHQNMRGGKGEVKIAHLLKPEEFFGKGRVFAQIDIEPGCSLGNHQHVGEIEAYYILRGEGTYFDNEEPVLVKAGDVAICDDMNWHGIENTGSETLSFMAMVIFTK